MNRIFAIVIVVTMAASVCGSAAASGDTYQFDCATPDTCLALADKYAHSDGSVGPAWDALSTRIRSFGKPAIPVLINALSSPDGPTRNFAGYTLRDMPGLTDADVQPILSAALKGDQGGWEPSALGRIGTPRAIDALMILLKKFKESENQIGYGFELLGARGVPYLISLYDCGDDCSEQLLTAVGNILGDLGPKAKAAIPLLTHIATDKSRPSAVRCAAVETLGSMGRLADSAGPELLTAWENASGSLREALEDALFSIGGDELTGFYDEVLVPPPEPESFYIREGGYFFGWTGSGSWLEVLARQGQSAASAVPAVEHLLEAGNRDMRVAAAFTLGFLGDTSSGPDLQSLLDSRDWLAVRVAAESLGRLRYAPAHDALEKVARNYWYPPVRAVARKALAALAGKHVYSGFKPKPTDGTSRLVDEFDPVMSLQRPKPCATKAQFPAAVGAKQKIYAKDRLKGLSQFAYTLSISVGMVNGSVQHEEKTYRPQFAVRAPGGWLLGADRGEFGGEVMWRPDSGPTVLLINDDIEDIYRIGSNRYVVTAGLAYVTDSGRAYLLTLHHEQWEARYWRRLPGEPLTSWRLKNDSILINTTGGSVILSSEGKVQMADCSSYGSS